MNLSEFNAIGVSDVSEYEAKYDTWESIAYNREELLRFLRALQYFRGARFGEKNYAIMLKVLESHDQEHLFKLASGDYETCRAAYREKMARLAAAEISTTGSYTTGTFLKISSLPLNDYKLVVKRVQELVNIAQDVTSQAQALAGLAGA